MDNIQDAIDQILNSFDSGPSTVKDRSGIRGQVEVVQRGPDGQIKYEGKTNNIVTDQGDILFASLAYTSYPTFNFKLGKTATATSKTKANAGAYIPDTDLVDGPQHQAALDVTYPKAGTSTPGSGSQVVFKRTYAAGDITTTTVAVNRVALVNATETANPIDGTLTYATALMPATVNMGALDTLTLTWTVTFTGT
jgi:hypothetical protein